MRPLIAITESDAWLPMGAVELTTFVLLDSGQVIFREPRIRPEPELRYRTAHLSKEEVSDFMAPFSRLSATSRRSSFELTDDSDQLTTRVVVWDEHGPVVVELYGRVTPFPGTRSLRAGYYRSPAVLSEVPQPILDVVPLAERFTHPGETSWLPDKIEILAESSGRSAGGGKPWPHDWPGLLDSSTHRTSRGMYRISLSKDHFAELRALVGPFHSIQNVVIDGRPMSVSYRFPIPQESLWLQPPAR